MDDASNLILKKLDEIDSRLKKLEGGSATVKRQEKDPLFDKALQIVNDYEGDVPASYLQQKLGIDLKRVEKIMDELEAAGYGTCYMK